MATLQVTVAELGATFLEGTTLASLAAAGLVQELRPGAVATCTLAFRGGGSRSAPPVESSQRIELADHTWPTDGQHILRILGEV